MTGSAYSGEVTADPGITSKQAIRRRVVQARTDRPPQEQEQAGLALRDRTLALPEIGTATSVAAYASAPGEPSTEALLPALRDRGLRVLLPVLRPDFDLDWAAYDAGDWKVGRFGIQEPVGPALGSDAVLTASVVICPGVAADPAGHRLGRGGGSYDRVLARLGRETSRVLLLYDDEVLPAVPVDPHDQAVDVVVTPRRTLRTGRRR
jgi:5-formyltetrahydrofolate cyclo-ligase